MQITVTGKASGRKIYLNYTPQELNLNLLEWLREKEIPIASSCDGEGVCKKCEIQNEWLTCQLTLNDFLQHQPDGVIYVDYL